MYRQTHTHQTGGQDEDKIHHSLQKINILLKILNKFGIPQI